MDDLTPVAGAVFETTVFLDYFKDMPDHRQPGKVAYRLDEILLLALLSILGGRGGVHRHGPVRAQEAPPLAALSCPSPTARRAMTTWATSSPRSTPGFRERFVGWVGALTKAPLDVIAIDGKTSRRSGRKGEKRRIHMVSAFAARQRLVLAQTKVNEKSNEIVAIPALLDMLSIEGAVVTIDAMGCQRAIAQKIIDKKADYVLALKGNQRILREDVELFVETSRNKEVFADTTVSADRDRRRRPRPDHGRYRGRKIAMSVVGA